MPYLPALSPHGRLYLEETQQGDAGAFAALSAAASPSLEEAFVAGSAPGLLALAVRRGETGRWPVEFAFWREFADAYLTALAQAGDPPEGAEIGEVPMPPELGFESTLRIPAMRGAEYAKPEVFADLWRELDALARAEARAAGGRKAWLGRIHPSLHLVGRVTFHLAENKRSQETPFAFMATYTHRLSAQEKPVHLPLGRALKEYAGAKNQTALRSLLEPVRQAAESSGWTRELLESRRIFEPQAWTPSQAYAFLRETPVLESSGIVTRIPDWWRNGRGPRPRVSVRVGENRAAELGVSGLLDFSIEATLGGAELTREEWRLLMKAQDGLVPLRGQWVEVDREKLQGVLEHWKRVEAGLEGDGVSFLEGMRLLAGVRIGGRADDVPEETADWSEVAAGTGLREILEALRRPDAAAGFDANAHLTARLRPYQETGVKWLWLMQSLGLGACLADDMGLGKTIQVLALLLQIKDASGNGSRGKKGAKAPSLIVAPASLLANWKSELERFAPGLRAVFLHPSETPATQWREAADARGLLAGNDVALTTYGQAVRLGWLSEFDWRLVILDEAQAIKNPGARQTRALKRLRAHARIALSGTPVENRLGDLWSLYDFLNPGLLGSATDFTQCVKGLQSADPPDFTPLRRLAGPYLLRRLKTDRTIISDLPDKTELTAWCALSKGQAALYEKGVRELAEKLTTLTEGIQRRGLVLAFLMRFKQVCNHPSHWLGDGEFAPGDSGKFLRLAELCEEIASRQEKALVFTQFREMTEPLAARLREIFGRPGLVLHGSTPVKERQKLVAAFQREDGPPFFVLSLKAGGTGLTLTAASHVIHFDRWWNPAVENQATDRAFRIGQKKNVLVHKFVCRGTIEERIDALIREKRALADSVLGPEGGAEAFLTEMSNDELLRFVSLDLRSAMGE
ncbi:MAG TPA: DEAD/DEAH box helicase [Verrucomicrobiales bacterium]|nr:DEAD/DEAH box helicase [Verrucomicrobiales bacterium]